MKIEILGTGCAKCQKLEKNAIKAVEDLGIDADVVKVEDLSEITSRGVMMTPALAIDGETKIKGQIWSPEKIKKLLEE